MLSWMAWTWPTALFFIFVFGCIALMGFLEYRSPGGAPRFGILRLQTTRGDRLFIWLLGSVFIFLAVFGYRFVLNEFFIALASLAGPVRRIFFTVFFGPGWLFCRCLRFIAAAGFITGLLLRKYRHGNGQKEGD